MTKNGDFTYNGVPIFKVGFNDFYMFYYSLVNNKRIFSKNILNTDLLNYYKKSRTNDFGICYEGVILNIGLNSKL